MELLKFKVDKEVLGCSLLNFIKIWHDITIQNLQVTVSLDLSYQILTQSDRVHKMNLITNRLRQMYYTLSRTSKSRQTPCLAWCSVLHIYGTYSGGNFCPANLQWGFSWFSSVPPGKCKVSISNYSIYSCNQKPVLESCNM